MHEYNCSQLDLMNFCQNTTCIAKLADKCGSSILEGCSACTECAEANVATTGCEAESSSEFCREACSNEIDCTLQLENLCETSRQQDYLQCAQCTGIHRMELQAAECSEPVITAFCSNSSCLTNLTDQCLPAAGQGCYACGECALANSNYELCGLEQDEMFCAQKSSPSDPSYLSCDEALAFFCDDKRKQGEMHCIQCTGKFADHPAMQRAQCTDTHEVNFCKNLTCYDVLDAACGREISCSSCAECVADVIIPPGLECTPQQKKLYCDPLPNTILAIAGCDKADGCADAMARTDVYGALLQNWTNGTGLKGPPNPKDAGMPRTGRWGFAAAVLNGNLGFVSGLRAIPPCGSVLAAVASPISHSRQQANDVLCPLFMPLTLLV